MLRLTRRTAYSHGKIRYGARTTVLLQPQRQRDFKKKKEAALSCLSHLEERAICTEENNFSKTCLK